MNYGPNMNLFCLFRFDWHVRKREALHVEHIDHEWKGFSAESIKAILARHGFVIIRDISGFGYFGRLALKMFYFFNIDHSKGQLTDVTPTYNKMPIFFLLFYSIIYFFVCIDAVIKIKKALRRFEWVSIKLGDER